METSTLDSNTPSTGDGSVFDLDLDKDELLKQMQKSVSESEHFWDTDERFKLKETWENNQNLYLPNHWKGREFYDYDLENLYQDPRIWISVETIMGMVAARIPQPECRPDEDTIIAKKLADDVQDALFSHSEKHRVDDLFGIAGRNMLVKRIGYIKLRFDNSIGEIVPEIVAPEDLIIDKDARYGDNPRFIAHKIRNKSAEELLAMFPDADKQEIYKAWGVQRSNKKGDLVAYKSQLAKRKDVFEIWFTHISEGKSQEGVMLTDSEFKGFFGGMDNPNWNYEDKGDMLGNFLDRPPKPFIEFVYLSDGTTFIPPTSAVEQAAGLQKNLDKRGYQVSRNIDQAGSGIIYNVKAISKEDMDRVVGAPDERIGIDVGKNGDVRSAFQRAAPPLLPPGSVDSMVDSRTEIDNIFGTHRPSRGEGTSNRTLGQDVMQQNQDLTRQDEIGRAMMRAATKYYRILTQMMKVYYREEHWFKISGEDGQFDFVMMKSDNIRDGIDITVQAGSMMPMDKMSQRAAVMELSTAGMIDPLTLYETIGLPNPKKILERTLKFKMDPMSFAQSVQEEEFSREAFMDIQVLLRGKMPELRDKISPQYLQFVNEYMLNDPEFEKQPDTVKMMFVEFLRLAQAAGNKQLLNLMTQAPTQQDMDMANQKAVEQAQIEGQMVNEGPQSKIPEQGQKVADKAMQQQPQPQGMM